jgi:hypothetical protein
MPKSITVRVKHEKPKGGAKSRRRSSRPRGFPSSRFGAVYVPRGTPEGIAKYGNTWREASEEQRAARRGVGYYGRGLYTGSGGYWGRKIGGWFGMPDIGDKLGDAVASGVSAMGGGGLVKAADLAGQALRATGHGSYAVNDAISGGGSDDPIPSFAPASDGCSVVISHKEYISDLFGPESPGFFQNTTYGINPGLERTFPWLSQIAQNYQEYTFSQLIFTYKTTISDFNSGTGQTGTLVMTTQYNPSDEPFADKFTMMESDLTSSGKLSSHQLHGVECDQTKMSGTIGKYVRSGPPTGQQDIKTYDLGTLNVAVCNIPKEFFNQSLGELHVSYTIELRKPKQFTNKGWGIPRDAWYLAAKQYWTVIDGVDTTHAWGQQNNIGCQIIPVHGAVSKALADAAPTGAAIKTAWNLTNIAVTPETTNSIFVVWPATAEGNYKVRLCVQASGTSAGLNQTSGSFVAGTAEIAHTAAVTGINDILCGDSNWHYATGADQSASGNIVMIYEFHVRVHNPASTAVGVADYPLNAAICLTLNTPANTVYGNIDLQIENYNTIFNYNQNGQSDEVVVCDGTDTYVSSGTIVPNWPPVGF